jgi:O-methyltransferase domain/Dimerisation domain
MQQDPTADALLKLAAGGWIAQAIHVAAKLGLADLLNERHKTAEELAHETSSHPDALFRLLRTLASLGIFKQDIEGRFGLTPMAEYLRTSKQGSLRGHAVMLGEPWVWRAWGDAIHAIRTGESGFTHAFGAPLFTYYAEHPEAHSVSVAGLTSRSAPENIAIADSYDFSGFKTVVDVGGGQGTLLATILKRNINLQGLLFDMPHVVEMARPMLEREGLQARCKLVPGNFFKAVPAGGDLYMLKRILHDWDDKNSREILMTCRAAMSAESVLIVLDAVVPVGNEPSFSKLQDLHMLVYAGGRERTEEEHRSVLDSAGFRLRRIIPASPHISIIEACVQAGNS